MIGIDTNVLVRYLVQDDPAQSRAATPGFSIASFSVSSSGYWKAPTGIQKTLSWLC